MSSTTLQPDPSSAGHDGPAQCQTSDWRQWLVPRSSTLISSGIYLIVLVTLMLHLGAQAWPWRGPLVMSFLLMLLVIDRVEASRWLHTPPAKVALLLLLLRLVLIAAVTWLGNAVSEILLLHGLLVYQASFYFGMRGIYAVGIATWLIFVSLEILVPTRSWTISDFAASALMLLFVATIASVRVDEQASRARAEHLLGELQRAHARLGIDADRALRVVRERNDLARQIHEQVGQGLAAMTVQLEKALVFRSVDPAGAEQAVRDAKRLGSEVLQDVRHSVAALRQVPQVAAVPPDLAVPPSAAAQLPSRPRALAWLFPRRFDLAPTIAYGALVTEWLRWMEPDRVPRWASFTVLGIVLLLLALDRVDYWVWGEEPPRNVAAALLAIRFVCFGVIAGLFGSWYLLWLIPLVPYYGYLYYGSRGGTRLGLVIWAVLAVMALLGYLSEGPQADIANYVIGMVFISLLLLLVVATSKMVLNDRAHRKRAETLLADLQGAHAQLHAYAEQTLAATAERIHLAREIHDGLGHYLTVINVQLEKALAFRALDPPVADKAIQTAKRLTGEALHEVRGAQRAFKVVGDSFSLLTMLDQLVTHMPDSVMLDVRIIGSEAGCSQQARLVLYRIAQEGLTNSQKHGQASKVQIELVFGAHEATLVLRDNGRGFDAAGWHAAQHKPQEHYGLQGARERVELIGGNFELISSSGAGTVLRAVVPKDPLGRSSRIVGAAQEVLP